MKHYDSYRFVITAFVVDAIDVIAENVTVVVVAAAVVDSRPNWFQI